jgi:polyisoprenoid-binding protein YceI
MALPIENGTWTIDPTHSQLGFSIKHLGISTIRGIFQESDGTVTVNGDQADISVSAKMASITTGNSMRDGHVQGEDFFDTANHPEMTFRSSAINVASGDKGTITGDLTIRGVTKPVTLDVTFQGTGSSPMDNSFRAGFQASGTINRTEFGVSYGVPLVSEEVQLLLDLQIVKN